MNDKDIPVTTLAGLTSLSDCEWIFCWNRDRKLKYSLELPFSTQRVTTFRHFAIALHRPEVAAVSSEGCRGGQQFTRPEGWSTRPAANQRDRADQFESYVRIFEWKWSEETLKCWKVEGNWKNVAKNSVTRIGTSWKLLDSSGFLRDFRGFLQISLGFLGNFPWFLENPLDSCEIFLDSS